MPWGLSSLLRKCPGAIRTYSFAVMSESANRELVVQHVDEITLASALIDQLRDQGMAVSAIMIETIRNGDITTTIKHQVVEHA